MRMVFTSAFSKTDDPMTMNQSAVKKHRRGRRGRRKRQGDIQPSSANKNSLTGGQEPAATLSATLHSGVEAGRGVGKGDQGYA